MKLWEQTKAVFNSSRNLYAVVAMAFILLTACHNQPADNTQNAQEITVAAAANLTDGVSYLVRSRATDVATNVETPSAGATLPMTPAHRPLRSSTTVIRTRQPATTSRN